MSNDTLEVNFDGLIGPSHNYGGLSNGNLASARNQGMVANPRQAALEGLEKMRQMLKWGFVQGVLPPLARPSFEFLSQLGFTGSDEKILLKAGQQAPGLLKAAYSASAMWAANAATVSPSVDAPDGRLHFTPANLTTMLHRSIETIETMASLLAIFGSDEHFVVHQALPDHPDLSDEGAANHVRLCRAHGEPGIALFVYGRTDLETHSGAFPARQARLAFECIARAHGLAPRRTVFAQQSSQAIDAGAFHNDVVCVGHLNTLFFHEDAFADTHQTIDDLQRASKGLFDLHTIMVPRSEVSLENAIASYLFNSQLLQRRGEDGLVLLAPMEVYNEPSSRAYCETLSRSNGPIRRVEYVDVRQSMRNGGGPACLRLRVVMTASERAACHQGALLTEDRIDRLQDIVRRTYRDRLVPSDFVDIQFANECRLAREAILDELDLLELA